MLSLHPMFVTWSYRYSTVFDRTSCTEQLHYANTFENFCAAISVTQTDSIAPVGSVVPSIHSQTNPVDIPPPKALS
jgi:hypothetical protein